MRSQEEISQHLIGPTYSNPENGIEYNEKGLKDDQRARHRQISRKDDNLPTLKVGIQDIDEAILYYFKEVIKPRATVNGTTVDVPVMYGSPERWQAIQKEGQYRDKDGKRQMPLIVFKRDRLTRVRNITTKIDANRPQNYYVQRVKYSARNRYDRFGILRNIKPQQEFIVTVVPDYVKIEYSCIVLTDFIEQMNPIVESINFASDSYWGDPKRFKFQSFIDSFKTENVVNSGEDRSIKTEFSITLNGYILSDTVNSGPYVNLKGFNKSQFNFRLEEKEVK